MEINFKDVFNDEFKNEAEKNAIIDKFVERIRSKFIGSSVSGNKYGISIIGNDIIVKKNEINDLFIEVLAETMKFDHILTNLYIEVKGDFIDIEY